MQDWLEESESVGVRQADRRVRRSCGVNGEDHEAGFPGLGSDAA